MKVFPLILAAVMAVTVTGCSSKEEEQEIVVPIYEADEINYNTAEAVIGDISEKYYVDGKFDYPYSETVSFTMSGKIKSIEVEENQEVKKGDILCVLDSSELDSQLEEKAVYVEQAQKTVDTLKSEGGSATELELAETNLELQQLEYQHLEDSLDDYNVYAPCDGIFKPDEKTTFGSDISDQKNAENIVVVGATVSSGQALGTISDHSKKYLVCDVYDITLENVNFGTKVKLTQASTEETGKVVDIIEGDNAGMEYNQYIILTDEDSELTDMQVNCCFEVYSKLDTVLVPSEAVKETNERTYVNVLIDGTKIEQDVEVGIEDGDQTEITSGLSGGEQVIIT